MSNETPRRSCALQTEDRTHLLSTQDERFLRVLKIAVDDLVLYDAAELTTDLLNDMRVSNLPMQMFTLYKLAQGHEPRREAIAASQYVLLLEIMLRTNGAQMPPAVKQTLEEELLWREHYQVQQPLIHFKDVADLYCALYPSSYARTRKDEAVRTA